MENSRSIGRGSSVEKTRKLVGMAIFTAVVVVLQVIAYAVKVGPVSITLVLIPVVVGAAMYGVGAGAFLGGVFGLVVLIGTISGVDPGAFMLWTANPVITALLCLVKGIAAGWLAGLVFKAIARNPKYMYVGVIVAAIVSPIVNTGIFLAAMVLFYHDTLVAWAGGTDIAYYTLIVLTGWNFVVEFGTNIVLSPVAVRVIRAGKRSAA
jgi:uncharacterized membrane protein